jgi:hypothetical protein
MITNDMRYELAGGKRIPDRGKVLSLATVTVTRTTITLTIIMINCICHK